jgi:ParB family transcriptional regulator, chromosome partitioning protein
MDEHIRMSIVERIGPTTAPLDGRATSQGEAFSLESGAEDDLVAQIEPGQHFARVRVELIAPAAEGQARQDINSDRLQALAESVKRSGVREPIIVTPHGAEPGRFQIVAGERRWRAAKIAGLEEIPCIIDSGLAEMPDKLLAQAEENLHRENLNPIEEAAVLAQLMQARRIGVREAGELIGKSCIQARRLHQLHTAAAPIKKAVVRGQIDARAALELTRIFNRLAREDETPSSSDALRRIEKLIERVVREQWSIRKLEQYTAKLVGRGEDDASPSSDAADVASVPAQSASLPPVAVPDARKQSSPSARPLFRESEGHLVIDLARLSRGQVEPGDREKFIALLEDLLARARRS